MITLSDDQLAALVLRHVREMLSHDDLERIAEKYIEARCQELTIEQACKVLRCSNLKQLQDKCRKMRIPIYKDRGQKSQYLLLSDITDRQKKFGELVPLEESRGGTVIRRLETQPGSAAAA